MSGGPRVVLASASVLPPLGPEGPATWGPAPGGGSASRERFASAVAERAG